MCKKIISVLLIILLLTFNVVYAGDFFYDNKWNSHYENIKLYFSNQQIITDVPSLIVGGRTLVPVRAFFEYIGASVHWNSPKQEVTVKTSDYNILLGINSYVAYVNGISKVMDVPAKIVTDIYGTARTLVPVRFISEQLGYKVEWDGQTQSVYVSKKQGTESIKSITSHSENNFDLITISTTSQATPVVTKMSNPERLILDFYGFTNNMGDGSTGKSGINFSNVRFANHSGYTRVVIDITGEYIHQLSSNNNILTVKLNKKDGFSGVVDSQLPQKPAQTPSPEPPIIFDGVAPGNGLVVIDPGHGGSDPGAIGYKNGEEYLYESTVNFDISLKVYNLLKAKGVNVAMTRTGDNAVGLKERAEFANNLNASLFICIHNNSATVPAAHGSMVYYYTGSGDSATKQTYGITSKELAQLLQNGILKYGGRYDRKIDDGSKFVVLYSTKMPAVLAECAFLSNEEELNLLSTDEFRTRLAEGISEGIINALMQMGHYN